MKPRIQGLRTALVGSIIILILIALMIPRPIFKPDWKSAVNAALADGNCDLANKLVFAAGQLRMPGNEEFTTRFDIESSCDKFGLYADKSESEKADAIENARLFGEFMKPSLFERIRDASFYTSFYYGVKYSLVPGALKDADLYWQIIWLVPHCNSIMSFADGGRPRYKEMRLVMEELARDVADGKEISIKDYLQFYDAATAFCARSLASLAQQLTLSGHISPTDDFIAHLWDVGTQSTVAIPAVEFEAAQWADTVRELAEQGATLSWYVEWTAATTPGCPAQEVHRPWAIYCADRSYRKAIETGDGSAMAQTYYHLVQAERWQGDVPEYRPEVEQTLTSACREAVEEIENTVSRIEGSVDLIDWDVGLEWDQDNPGLSPLYEKISTLPECIEPDPAPKSSAPDDL